MPKGVASPAKLTDEHRVFIVTELARYRAPTAILRELKDEFGVEVTKQSITHYDPGSSKNKRRHNLAKRWVQLFDDERRKFVTDLEANLPYAVKAVRIRELSEAADRFRDKKNDAMFAELLTMIAKEVGNVHTNRREHTGADGKPIQHQNVPDMTPEQVAVELRENLLLLGVNQDAVDSALGMNLALLRAPVPAKMN